MQTEQSAPPNIGGNTDDRACLAVRVYLDDAQVKPKREGKFLNENITKSIADELDKLLELEPNTLIAALSQSLKHISHGEGGWVILIDGPEEELQKLLTSARDWVARHDKNWIQFTVAK